MKETVNDSIGFKEITLESNHYSFKHYANIRNNHRNRTRGLYNPPSLIS